MSVTLQQLYDLVKDKADMKLVAGEAGLNHIVTWVHMVEGIDISSFLEGNEVAFTTGIALKDNQKLMELVRYNHKKNVAGMVINVGPFIEEIPQEVLDYANENEFPIFRVPWRVHMANIMRDFTAEIHRDSLRYMELEVAFKNAFYSGDNKELYMPSLQKNGYRREWNYIIATVEILEQDGKPIQHDDLQRLLRRSKDYFRLQSKEILVMELESRFVIVFCNKSEEYVKERLEAFGNLQREHVLQGKTLRAGVGRQVLGLHNVGISFNQSEQVLRLQKGRGQKNQVYTYSEMGLYKLIFALEGQTILEEYYRETLGELERYDTIKGTDYYAFLKDYFHTDGTVQDVAEKLHLHRNSIHYKLRKIEEILGISLSDKTQQTKLMMAYMIKDFE